MQLIVACITLVRSVIISRTNLTMHCGDEAKFFTVTWRIDNFRKYSSTKKLQTIRSSVWETEGNDEGRVLWRLSVDPSLGSDLAFTLVSLKEKFKEKDYRYEMCLLTSSGEVELSCKHSNNCCYSTIEKDAIFGEKSNTLLPQGRLSLCCRIYQPKLKPGRCILQTALHELKFPWSIEGFNRRDSDSTKRSFYQKGSTLISMFLFKSTAEKSTHEVRLALLPNCGRWSTFLICNISMKDECGQVVSVPFYPPQVSWGWNVAIYPEKCKDNDLHLEFDTIIAIHMEPQQFPITSDTYPSSSNTLADDFLQLYKKGTLTDVTLNTEGKSLQAHRIVLATRSPVLQAMFEKDKMIEGQSGAVVIEDIDSETMDRLLVYLYSDSLEDLLWEEAAALYYAADKYAVLPLKQKCAAILMFGLTPDNVCDALVLADKHSDERLMSCAVDFVRDHEEILASSAWASLEKTNSPLTIKVLRQVILEKIKK